MSLTRHQKKAKHLLNSFESQFTKYGPDIREAENFVAADYKDWTASEAYKYSQELVTVYNNITGDGKMPIKIRRCEVGTCCDPSTEKYHSM